MFFFFFSSRRRHTRCLSDWSSDVCSSDLDGRGSGNNRNGTSRKKVQGDFGVVEIEVPRDRNGTFEPKLIPKHERRFNGFDGKILSMYARGMTTRDIQAHL